MFLSCSFLIRSSIFITSRYNTVCKKKFHISPAWDYYFYAFSSKTEKTSKFRINCFVNSHKFTWSYHCIKVLYKMRVSLKKIAQLRAKTKSLITFSSISGCCFSKSSDTNEETPFLSNFDIGDGQNAKIEEAHEASHSGENAHIFNSVVMRNSEGVENEIDRSIIESLVLEIVSEVSRTLSPKHFGKRVDDFTTKTEEYRETATEHVDRKSKVEILEELPFSEGFEEENQNLSETYFKNQYVKEDNLKTTEIPKSCKRKRKRKNKKGVTEGQTVNKKCKDSTKDDISIVQKRPNYFVALQITNSAIHQHLKEIQDHIILQDKRMKTAMVSLSTLHITLMVMHISDTEEYLRASGALTDIHQVLNEDLSKYPLELEFKGLGHFNNKVIFAKISSGEHFDRLNTLANNVTEFFERASIFSTDKRSFNPHLTVMKLSHDPKLYRKGIKTIKPSLYASYKDECFGTQVIQGIQLLSMDEPKDEAGYYVGQKLLFDLPT